MGWRKDQCRKVCRIIDNFLANRPTERDSLIVAVQKAFDALEKQRWIPCGKCIHADGKHRWCKVLDRTINEDYFCYWAEPWKEGEA